MQQALPALRKSITDMVSLQLPHSLAIVDVTAGTGAVLCVLLRA
jgi:hypothetical protein